MFMTLWMCNENIMYARGNAWADNSGYIGEGGYDFGLDDCWWENLESWLFGRVWRTE